MGGNHSKKKMNEDLKNLGEKENKKDDINSKNEEQTLTKNNFILTSNSTDPEKDYNI